MRALSAAELFEVWERGQGQSAAQRALLLLALAGKETPPEQLARLGVGRRDSDLLALREQTFGSEMSSVVACPACGVQLEFRLQVDDIRATPLEEPDALGRVTEGEYEIRFRLPTSLDLAILDPSDGVETNRRRLLERCVISATRAGREMTASDLPGSAVLAIAHRMGELDPQADVQLALACPQCHHSWETSLDIVSYFWSEINGWAQRILGEIHSLASAYGWREADILALSALRRQAYLELIEQ